MLNGAIIKRKATTGTYKIAIDDDKNRLLVATWDHLDQNPVWERCPHSLLDEDAVEESRQLRDLHGKRIYIRRKGTRIGGRIYVILYLEVP